MAKRHNQAHTKTQRENRGSLLVALCDLRLFKINLHYMEIGKWLYFNEGCWLAQIRLMSLTVLSGFTWPVVFSE